MQRTLERRYRFSLYNVIPRAPDGATVIRLDLLVRALPEVNLDYDADEGGWLFINEIRIKQNKSYHVAFWGD
jgi:hypothetical protein